MKFSATFLTAILALAGSAVSVPGRSKPDARGRCKNPSRVRQEWRKLTDAQKDSYLDAVKCLHSKPGKLTKHYPGALTRYEDFVGEHQQQTQYIHLVGHFLPWHRWFLWEFESALRNECGYKGALPYWDYSLDSEDIALSPVFAAKHGFGGNGVVPPGEEYQFFFPYCIGDGPFADWTLHIGQMGNQSVTSRCLARNIWSDIGRAWLTAEQESSIKAQTYYGAMARTLEGEPDFAIAGMHGAGHFGVGGSSADVYTSNSEPLFYLHHANLDRIWWEWQSADPKNRIFDISGSIIPRYPEVLGGDYSKLPDGNVTLDFTITLGDIAKEKTAPLYRILDAFGGRPDGP